MPEQPTCVQLALRLQRPGPGMLPLSTFSSGIHSTRRRPPIRTCHRLSEEHACRLLLPVIALLSIILSNRSPDVNLLFKNSSYIRERPHTL
ncbi:hypothetical protein O9H85_15635 [Paenibacillus filicis]|uniref:Uncharacterized protein n=1 Tax=Paenibacillus gyeongsangnamensis TaxID=3388067 RepID=A0ABT4QAH3_9BACL|nr:hypothetical protein [Paenibacillus filicis]MCZ8513841.1 hypothetical protein [Paenibacillus filicis]